MCVQIVCDEIAFHRGRKREREKNRPLLLESKLQHLYPSDKIFHQILVTSALSLQKGNLCLHTTEGEREREVEQHTQYLIVLENSLKEK